MNGKYPSLLKLLHKLIMMRYITEKSDTHKSSIKKPDRKKRYFLQFILLLGLIASLSSCRTSAPRLDYQALARASILLGVDINMEDNHKLYLEAADWIGVPYRGGGDSKRGADCSEGDLVFFTSSRSKNKVAHVGIYLKNGKFIHSSTSKGVIVSNLNENYYTKHWISGGRIR